MPDWSEFQMLQPQSLQYVRLHKMSRKRITMKLVTDGSRD